jgi:hypothetical protein
LVCWHFSAVAPSNPFFYHFFTHIHIPSFASSKQLLSNFFLGEFRYLLLLIIVVEHVIGHGVAACNENTTTVGCTRLGATEPNV